MAGRGGAGVSAARRAANRKALGRSLGGLRQLRAQGALTPREGQGDYRGAESLVGHKHVFLPLENGLPEFRPYVRGAPRPARATRGIDYAAIAAADAEIDGKTRKPNAPARGYRRTSRRGYAVPQAVAPQPGAGLTFRVRETA